MVVRVVSLRGEWLSPRLARALTLLLALVEELLLLPPPRLHGRVRAHRMCCEEELLRVAGPLS